MDEKDCSQDRMHLDTYFNVVKKGVCVMEDIVLFADENSKYRYFISFSLFQPVAVN